MNLYYGELYLGNTLYRTTVSITAMYCMDEMNKIFSDNAKSLTTDIKVRIYEIKEIKEFDMEDLPIC